MFDRFIRLARAKKALREQRYLDALQEAGDRLIADDRRAERIREQALSELVQRARARLRDGDVDTARAEARRLRQLTSRQLVEDLVREVDAAVVAAERRRGEQHSTRAEFRRLVGAGDLRAAEDLLATMTLADDEREALRQHLQQRRAEAVQKLDQAAAEAEAGRARAAADLVRQALALDRGLPQAACAAALRQIATALVAEVEAGLSLARARPGEVVQALQRWSAGLERLGELHRDPDVEKLRARLATATGKALRGCEVLADAVELVRAARRASLALAPADEAVAELLATLAAAADGDGEVAIWARLQEAANAAGMARLAQLAGERVRTSLAGEEQLTSARQLLEQGELEAARAMFVAFLEQHPLHEGAQRELSMLDESLADLDRRLADLRLTLRAGRLREACTVAMGLTGTNRVKREAQAILSEAQSRMALVDKGLDEVRVALHGRAAATIEGVRHCLKRLQELAKVQVDHEELPAVIAAVSAEIDALERCQRLAAALGRGELQPVEDEIGELLKARGQLLASERIDARLCEIGDEVAQVGERALGHGRLSVMQRCAAVLRQLEPVRADFAARAAGWAAEHDRRDRLVRELLAEARARLVARDLAEAERLVDEARQHWREAAEVQAFAHRLQKLRQQTQALEQVATMADEKDFLGAQQKLASIDDVPPMLRTRVYDMKKDLARAQGLEGAFLLRVDEGGEHLVVRAESVSIGNVRKACADLPVLANVAGRHATIRRSMSFHGGMQDEIVADDGEVRVGGQRVEKRVLADGDQVRLGSTFGFVYQRPTARSLTSRVVLQSGFQVAGTDRVLLMKDRGRDGRVLLGAGNDVHVAVGSASGVVELFATNNGQMRVFCEQGGTIDGAPFQGEHPIAAGQIVEAAGVTFVLMPWQPGA